MHLTTFSFSFNLRILLVKFHLVVVALGGNNFISDSEDILEFFLVVKHAKLLNRVNVSTPLNFQTFDKIENFIHMFNVHSSRMTSEARLELVTMMFQDLARGKLKESRLFNFMTAFIIKLLDLYPGEIKKT